MKWLYNVDLFFWNLQKISTFVIVGWLLQLWWRRYRGQYKELVANLKSKEPIYRFVTRMRTYRSQIREQATLVFGRIKNLTNK
ncbi:MAG: hypothetical protein GX050_08890 [Firmicutes bacterium]|nr:hypothetical protein [Bacillota bacterium]